MQTLSNSLLFLGDISPQEFTCFMLVELFAILGFSWLLHRWIVRKAIIPPNELSGVVIEFYADTKDWSFPDYYRGWNGPGWYFWDETDTCCYGPYDSEKETRSQAKQYFEYLKRENE